MVSAIEECEDLSLKSFVMNILELSKSLASLKFMHVFKTLNVTAHFLAKFYINSNDDAEIFDTFLGLIRRSIHEGLLFFYDFFFFEMKFLFQPK